MVFPEGRTVTGVNVSWYSDEREPDAFEVPASPGLPQLLLLHHEQFAFGEPVVTDEMIDTIKRPEGMGPPSPEVKPARPVKAQTVAPAPAQADVRYSATIEPFEQVPLSFKASGYIDDILRRRGEDGNMRVAQAGTG